jgi:type I site-specific restriction endonuclease
MVSPNPEQEARQTIDALPKRAGWKVFDAKAANRHAGHGVAVLAFPLAPEHGTTDYVLCGDGNATEVTQVKKAGTTRPSRSGRPRTTRGGRHGL